MRASVADGCVRVLLSCSFSLPRIPPRASLLLLARPRALAITDRNITATNATHGSGHSSSFSTFAYTTKGGGKGMEMKGERQRSSGRRGGGAGKDKIDALGRLLVRILRHMASELNLSMRSDGYVKVQDLLKLNMKTFADIPLRSHTVDDIKETVETESLLKPILSVEEVPVCVHGTYKRNLESILESGLKRMKRLHIHFSCGLPTDGEVISGKKLPYWLVWEMILFMASLWCMGYGNFKGMCVSKVQHNWKSLLRASLVFVIGYFCNFLFGFPEDYQTLLRRCPLSCS
ncbi:uncharacterized protein LOC131165785 isoform X3 [Malania oleifera]|uniref:uncharacterized protein LOC131165785 isoform X3 n=1 Tax=Malania oleifera TaxID=397392 RepID=UPI0025ADB4CB|nr:uncharacterized protein LOC131165785 isoform X3 [Malania oleifera]